MDGLGKVVGIVLCCECLVKSLFKALFFLALMIPLLVLGLMSPSVIVEWLLSLAHSLTILIFP